MGQKTDRIMLMLKLVPTSPQKISVERLKAYLENAGHAISSRTIQRDLVELSRSYPLELDDRSKPYGWSFMKDRFKPASNMNPFEALSYLLVMDEFSGRLPRALKSYLEPQEAQAVHTLIQYGPNLSNFRKKVFSVPRGFQLLPAEINSDTLNTVYDALLREKVLELDYWDTKGAKINPLGLLYRDQIAYLVCTFWQYNDIRQLAIHRIRNCNVTDEEAHIPKDFQMSSYQKSNAMGYSNTSSKLRLVLRMKEDAAWHLRETPLSHDQMISHYREGLVEVKATVQDRKDLLWWILGFGDSIEVISPEKLRGKVKDIAQKMSKIYEQY